MVRNVRVAKAWNERTNEQKAEGSQEVSYLYGSAESGPHAMGLNYSGVLYFAR